LAPLLLPHHVARRHQALLHALEDLDAATRERVVAYLDRLGPEQAVTAEMRALLAVPPGDRGYSKRIWDILDNIAGAVAGGSELAVADLPIAEGLLDRLRAALIRSYTYVVSPILIRGSRPSPEKLRDLYLHNGVRSTVNLCREMHRGDAWLVRQAGLAGRLRAVWIPITDNDQPDLAQVFDFLRFLLGPHDVPAYVHCEQGVGRTGVMVGCYRQAAEGWAAAQAIDEARRFGNSMPTQLAFLAQFGEVLSGGDPVWSPRFRRLQFPRPGTAPPPPVGVTLSDCLDPGA
jgi:hypothetical protein